MAHYSDRLRVTVWEFLVLLLIPGVGIAAIRAGGLYVHAMLTIGGLWLVAMAIGAVYGQGKFRSFAGGFLIASGMYAGLVTYFGVSELDPDTSVLPSSRALRPVRDAMTTYSYSDAFTGTPLTAAEAAAWQAAPGSRLVSRRSDPEGHELMSVGHLLIGLLLGYLGGKGAVLLSGRQRVLGDPEES